MRYDCYLAFLGLGLAFFGEDRLATPAGGTDTADLY